MAKKTKKSVVLPTGIRQRANGRFLVDVTVNGQRKTEVSLTLEEAIEKRAALLSQLHVAAQNGGGQDVLRTVTRGGWTLQQAYERTNALFWEDKSSVKTNLINSTAAIKFFGGEKLVCTFTQADIDNYQDHLVTLRNSNATINRKMSALSKILRTAEDRGHIQKRPTMIRRREPVGRLRFLTPHEEIRLLQCFDYLGKPDHKEAVIVLLDTGFRTGELWGLEATNVNLAQNSITLWRTKNFQPRTIPMSGRVRDIISRRVYLYPEGQLFPDSGKTWLRAPWENARRLLGMEQDKDFVPHMLRHTCCSRLVQAGVHLATVKSWMGHNDLTTTMRYTHLSTDSLTLALQVAESAHARAILEVQANEPQQMPYPAETNQQKPFLQ